MPYSRYGLAARARREPLPAKFSFKGTDSGGGGLQGGDFMSTSERAFNQVKAILGKLDRSIDQARQKRLQTVPPMASRQAGQAASPIGRAQPLRSPADKDHAASNAFQRWSR
jgi:hypothetical protein